MEKLTGTDWFWIFVIIMLLLGIGYGAGRTVGFKANYELSTGWQGLYYDQLDDIEMNDIKWTILYNELEWDYNRCRIALSDR